MPDRYKNRAESLEGPAAHAFSVVPNDTAPLPEVTRALYVGGDGNVSVELLSGAVVTLAAVQAGTLLPLRISKVRATGTTADQMVGLV